MTDICDSVASHIVDYLWGVVRLVIAVGTSPHARLSNYRPTGARRRDRLHVRVRLKYSSNRTILS